jgi:hypothetical protein
MKIIGTILTMNAELQQEGLKKTYIYIHRFIHPHIYTYVYIYVVSTFPDS